MRFWSDKIFQKLEWNLEDSSYVHPDDDNKVFRVLLYSLHNNELLLWFDIRDKTDFEKKQILINWYALTESTFRKLSDCFNPYLFIKKKPTRSIRNDELPNSGFYHFQGDYMFFTANHRKIDIYQLSTQQQRCSFNRKKVQKQQLPTQITLINANYFAVCNGNVIEIRRVSSTTIYKRIPCDVSNVAIHFFKGNNNKGIFVYDLRGHFTIYNPFSGKIEQEASITGGPVSSINRIRASESGNQMAFLCPDVPGTKGLLIKICDLSEHKITQTIKYKREIISEATFTDITEKAFNGSIENGYECVKALEQDDDNKFSEEFEHIENNEAEKDEIEEQLEYAGNPTLPQKF